MTNIWPLRDGPIEIDFGRDGLQVVAYRGTERTVLGFAPWPEGLSAEGFHDLEVHRDRGVTVWLAGHKLLELDDSVTRQYLDMADRVSLVSFTSQIKFP